MYNYLTTVSQKLTFQNVVGTLNYKNIDQTLIGDSNSEVYSLIKSMSITPTPIKYYPTFDKIADIPQPGVHQHGFVNAYKIGAVLPTPLLNWLIRNNYHHVKCMLFNSEHIVYGIYDIYNDIIEHLQDLTIFAKMTPYMRCIYSYTIDSIFIDSTNATSDTLYELAIWQQKDIMPTIVKHNFTGGIISQFSPEFPQIIYRVDPDKTIINNVVMNNNFLIPMMSIARVNGSDTADIDVTVHYTFDATFVV